MFLELLTLGLKIVLFAELTDHLFISRAGPLLQRLGLVWKLIAGLYFWALLKPLEFFFSFWILAKVCEFE